MAFMVEGSICSSVPTVAISCLFTLGLIDIFFLGDIFIGFFLAAGAAFFFAAGFLAFGFGLGFSSSSSFSSGAEPSYFSAYFSIDYASMSPAKAEVASFD